MIWTTKLIRFRSSKMHGKIRFSFVMVTSKMLSGALMSYMRHYSTLQQVQENTLNIGPVIIMYIVTSSQVSDFLLVLF
jgi:hypothetical protein